MKTQNVCVLAQVTLVAAMLLGTVSASAQEAPAGEIQGGFRLAPGTGDSVGVIGNSIQDRLLGQLARLRQVEEELRKQLDATPADRRLRARLLGTIHMKYRVARVILGGNISDAQREISRRNLALARMLATDKHERDASPGAELNELRGHASAFRRFCEMRSREDSTKVFLIADVLADLDSRLGLKRAGLTARHETGLLVREAERDIAGWRKVVNELQRVLTALARHERREMNDVIKSCS